MKIRTGVNGKAGLIFSLPDGMMLAIGYFRGKRMRREVKDMPKNNREDTRGQNSGTGKGRGGQGSGGGGGGRRRPGGNAGQGQGQDRDQSQGLGKGGGKGRGKGRRG